MELPVSFLNSIANATGFDKKTFEEVHASDQQITSIRLNPSKLSIENCQLPIDSQIPWTKHGYYLRERPSFTFDPLFHAGCYYVQEASSMFLEQALRQHADLSKPLRVLDLCAAPGGKSTHIQSLLSKDSLLVSNEVIRARASILKENIIKWGCGNIFVSNNDPRDFAVLENYFDIIVVDAPCSGSGLFRRDPEAIDEWSLNNVALCSQRQQRILADVWPALKKDGLLVYSTCSYSTEEDEDIVKWLSEEMAAENIPVQINNSWGIVDSGDGYRFWPNLLRGEGFFLSCFRKLTGDDEINKKVKTKAAMATKAEIAVISKWVKKEDIDFIKHQQTVYAWPAHLSNEYNWLLNNLRVVYSGTIIGELMRDKLVPDHALAMSTLTDESISRIALNHDEAIDYLRRTDIAVATKEKGWQLVTYADHSLGWVNVLSNRINNYYPKEMRILKNK